LRIIIKEFESKGKEIRKLSKFDSKKARARKRLIDFEF